MLPQANRLRTDQDIKTLFAKGKSVFGDVCGLRFVRNRLPVVRIGIVVSTKVSKKAVVRNRLKRRAVTILHHHLASLPPGYDLLVLVKPTAIGKTASFLEKDLLLVLKKAKIFG